MARFTQDREDLLLEATALVPRLLLRLPILGKPCEVFAGFRGESLSLYFDGSPVYHFNSSGELRRAFVGDRLIKAEKGQLVSSVRERSAEEVTLISTPFSEPQREQFSRELSDRLAALRSGLESGEFELMGQVTADGEGVSKLQAWLADWPGFKIAQVANVS